MRQKTIRMKGMVVMMMMKSVLLVGVFPGVLQSHVLVESVVVLAVSLGLLGVEEVVGFLPMMVLVMSLRVLLEILH
jgi:hypothetical protein